MLPIDNFVEASFTHPFIKVPEVFLRPLFLRLMLTAVEVVESFIKEEFIVNIWNLIQNIPLSQKICTYQLILKLYAYLGVSNVATLFDAISSLTASELQTIKFGHN